MDRKTIDLTHWPIGDLRVEVIATGRRTSVGWHSCSPWAPSRRHREPPQSRRPKRLASPYTKRSRRLGLTCESRHETRGRSLTLRGLSGERAVGTTRGSTSQYYSRLSTRSDLAAFEWGDAIGPTAPASDRGPSNEARRPRQTRDALLLESHSCCETGGRSGRQGRSPRMPTRRRLSSHSLAQRT